LPALSTRQLERAVYPGKDFAQAFKQPTDDSSGGVDHAMAPAAGDRHGFRRDEWNEPGSVGHVDDRGYRAPLLRKPRLLLLDEPTAHLDGGALYQVGIALKWPMAGRTTFLIVHRLETIQLADRILLLDRGRLLATERPAAQAPDFSVVLFWSDFMLFSEKNRMKAHKNQ
jgi:ABC-type cobalamin/Fe3+-siderophores transport system ATPase subunit